jgi:hypothetical protein
MLRTVRFFRQKSTLEDGIGSHACSLEALPCVWSRAFLSGVHFLTGSHCKLRPNTEVADNTGAMFLFNPTMRAITIALPLSGDGSASLGFACSSTTAPVLVRQLASSERTTTVAYNLKVLDCTDTLNLTLLASTARVIGFEQWKYSARFPRAIYARGCHCIPCIFA